jgi:two-component system response regulator MprA
MSVTNRLCVLVIEDDPKMVQLLSIGLGHEGLNVISASTGPDGLRLAVEKKPDLVVLDWMLPGMDGVTVCRRIRELSDVPVIIVTARDAVPDKVAGLDAGADDYLVKPFELEELLARVRARLRGRVPDPSVATFGNLSLDANLREVERGGRSIALTTTEFNLLSFFIHHPRQVMSKSQLLEAVWGYDFGGEANIVEQYVSSLRRKLGAPQLLHTLRGAGYVLREPPS